MYYRLTDILDKKFAIGTGVHLFDIWGLSSQAQSVTGPIWTIFGHKMAHLKSTIRSKFYPDTYIEWFLIYILECEKIRWKLKLCYMAYRRGWILNFAL